MKCNPVVPTLTALLAVALVVPTVRAEERTNVPDQLKWNTADLYATEDAWYQAKDDIAARIPKLGEFQGRLGESADVFYQAISAMMTLDQDFTRLYVYASMRLDEDTRVGKPREMTQIAQQLAVQYYSTLSYVRPEILALGAEKVNAFVAAEPRLAPYRMYLDDILRYAPHTLSAAEEKISSQASIMSDIAGGSYRTFKDADLPYPEITLSTGEKVRLDAQAFTKYRASTVRADRDLVFESFFGAFKGYERTLGTMMDGNVKTHMFDKDVHKFGSCLEDALFGSNIPPAVYTQLIADVHANLPTLHRYLKLRQRMMGLDTLRYEDLYAPIVGKVDLRYTTDQAKDLVLKAVAPLGPDYVAALRHGYDARWVDWVPTTGKRSGAYSTGAYGVHPFQLQNFTGLYEEVSTLAHESGHSMHTYLADKTQPYATHDYKIFVAEVASTLNENLLLHYMLDQTKDRDTRLFLLGTYLDGLRTTLFRQTMFAEFELKAHEMGEKGEPITGERLTQLYLDLARDYYGDAAGVCKVKDLYGVEWAYIPHFYYDFYVFQYATSITASSQIAANIRADAALKGGKATTKNRDAYLAMLAAGGSKYPIALLQGAGVDMTTSAPFNAAIHEMNSIMDEMEKLLAKK
jgi:oligoendopeptidase F